MSNFSFAQKIYIEAIEKFKKENYGVPTVRQIAELVHVSSPATVCNMLKRLKKKGYDYKVINYD